MIKVYALFLLGFHLVSTTNEDKKPLPEVDDRVLSEIQRALGPSSFGQVSKQYLKNQYKHIIEKLSLIDDDELKKVIETIDSSHDSIVSKYIKTKSFVRSLIKEKIKACDDTYDMARSSDYTVFEFEKKQRDIIPKNILFSVKLMRIIGLNAREVEEILDSNEHAVRFFSIIVNCVYESVLRYSVNIENLKAKNIRDVLPDELFFYMARFNPDRIKFVKLFSRGSFDIGYEYYIIFRLIENLSTPKKRCDFLEHAFKVDFDDEELPYWKEYYPICLTGMFDFWVKSGLCEQRFVDSLLKESRSREYLAYPPEGIKITLYPRLSNYCDFYSMMKYHPASEIQEILDRNKSF